MQNNQVTTITFFRYEGLRHKWWAFKQMGLSPFTKADIDGLQFVKMLGSGGRMGFSIFPSFEVYGLLCTWESREKADCFFEQNRLYGKFCDQSAEQWTVFMQAVMAHGHWDGQEPFSINREYKEDQPVCVITRATIHPKQLWRFWQFVPQVSRSISGRDGLLFSVGIGELPLVQQATFSLWENSSKMKAYAYQSPLHKEVVRKTRELGWYKEELFARFRPVDSRGSWMGREPWAVGSGQ